MNGNLSPIQAQSNWAAQRNRPNKMKMTTQTAATFDAKGTRAPAWARRSRTPPSLEGAVTGVTYCFEVMSTPSYHFFDSSVMVPSACISPTILSTAARSEASLRLEALSKAMLTGS